jgi:CcmD family protein
MENAGFLFSAYIIVWVALFGYVLFLVNKQKNVQKDLDTLKSASQKKESS